MKLLSFFLCVLLSFFTVGKGGDRDILQKLYDNTGGASWFNSTNWKSPKPLSYWFGVTTDSSGSVTKLSLVRNGLRGSLPSEISGLEKLKSLRLGFNELTGSFPSIRSLKRLKVLELEYNHLSGDLFQDMAAMSNLTFLIASNNNFTGLVPTEVSKMKNLQVLDIAYNPLDGSLPVQLCQLESLNTIMVSGISGLCYPACINSTLSHIDLRGIRCQDKDDVALCNLVDSTSVFSVLSNQFSLTTYYIDSQHPSPNSFDETHNFSVYGATQYEIKVEGTTDRSADLFQICYPSSTSSNVSLDTCLSYTETALPGYRGRSSLFVSASKFSLRFKSSSCESFDDFDQYCFGYHISVIAKVYSVVGWECNLAVPSADSSSLLNGYKLYASERCWWTGITCTNGNINTIDLKGLGLTGIIPSEIAYFQYLSVLDLNSNSLTGSIPSTIASITTLRYLDVSENLLTGGIPTEFGTFFALNYLLLNSNRLTGNIPLELGNINSTLTTLQLSSNDFEGVLDELLVCALEFVEEVDIESTHLSCYEACPFDNFSISVGSLMPCSPTAAPTIFVPASTPNEKINILYIIIPAVVGFILIVLLAYIVFIFFSPASARIQIMQNRERQARLSVLPLHFALINAKPAEELLRILKDRSDTILEKDFDGNNAFDLAVQCNADQSVLLEITRRTLPFDPNTKMERSFELHGDVWVQLVQVNKYSAIVTAIMKEFVFISTLLANARDREGRCAFDLASPACRKAIEDALLFFGRYYIDWSAAPIHTSETCRIIEARDRKEYDIRVAMKFMKHRDHFLREVTVRSSLTLSPECVLTVLHSYDSDQDPAFQKEIETRGLQDYPYCCVMPLADKSLRLVLGSERIAAKDWQLIRIIGNQIGEALEHIHRNGLVHGDVKPRNIVRLNNRMLLIDLDSCGKVGEANVLNDKLSSAYLPPEMISDNGRTIEIMSEGKRPLLHPSIDVWAFGMVMYELCSGITLFWQDNDDNIDADSLSELATFAGDFKRRKLEKISNIYARNIVSQMLTKNPAKRPTTRQILAHPFFSGKKAPRMAGVDPEFDVFISYRVKSDAQHAERIYDLLTNRGVKVWWDKKCLKPGVSWEDGFCVGLVKSRIFLPLLSKEAINSDTDPRRSFACLEESSPCDNVLLEHWLSLELHARDLIEKIYPVMIGNVEVSMETHETIFGNYFVQNCHPTLSKAVVVKSVEAKLEEHLEKSCLGSPLLGPKTVNQILGEISVNQGFVVAGNVEHALDPLVEDVLQMLSCEDLSPSLKARSNRNLFSPSQKQKSFVGGMGKDGWVSSELIV